MEKVKLDSYEEKIEKALENGEYTSLSSEELEEFTRKAEEGAREFMKRKKKRQYKTCRI